MPQLSNNTSLSFGDLKVAVSLLHWLFFPWNMLAVAILTLSPLLLVTILQGQRLWQESHYLLLANILLSDLAYLVFHMLISPSNLGSWSLGLIACGILTDAIFTAYISTILPSWPLCYTPTWQLLILCAISPSCPMRLPRKWWPSSGWWPASSQMSHLA